MNDFAGSLDSRTPDIGRWFIQDLGGFDLVAQDETGAGIAGLGLVELVAEGGQGLGAPGRGEGVEPDQQFAIAGMDVAGGGERLADQRVGLVAGAGVVACQGAGQGGLGV
jgi:hypothetical protein